MTHLLKRPLLIATQMLAKCDRKSKRWFDVAFLACTFLTVLTNRARFFQYAPSLNPDEALFAANAMRSVFGWTNWGMIDPTTSGPLNSIILTWPRAFGGDLTLYSGRLTAAMLAFGTVALIYATTRTLLSPGWAVLATLPTASFYALTTDTQFVHFSSEQLPVFLIAGAIFFLVSAIARPTLFNLGMGSIFTGFIPFAKLQGLPWAALLGTAMLLCSWLARQAKWSSGRLIAVTMLFGCLPSAIFVIPLIVTGDFEDFTKSYFLQQYLRGDRIRVSIAMLGAQAPTVVALWQSTAILVLVAIATFVTKAIIEPSARWRYTNLSGTQIGVLLLAASSLLVALVTVLVPARNYSHYLQFLIPALSLWTIGSVSILGSILTDMSRTRGAILLGSYLAIMPFLPKYDPSYVAYVTRSDGAFMTGSMTSPRILTWLLPRDGDSFSCWGWRPECYVDSAIKSATRDATNENQIYDTALRPYFRSRFITDFQKARPDFVFDTVSPGAFGFDNSQQTINTFPEFDRVIKSEFELISKVVPADRCPRLYVRKTRLEALSEALVAFDAIMGPSDENSTPRAVDDGITFETCNDHWLLPKGQTGTLSISFRAKTAVKSIAILNTRGGMAGDRASDHVRLSLMNGNQTVAIREVALNHYPRWTEVAFGSLPPANSLRVEILSYIGIGAGLNEVKVYRNKAK